jgi:predicted nucleic acid-binding protein
MIVVDVNLRVYAVQPTSPHHAAARAWLDELRERPFSGADEAILGYMCIVTRPRTFATPATVDPLPPNTRLAPALRAGSLGRVPSPHTLAV